VFGWQDSQHLRGGQNWEQQVTRVINEADYFVFVQTENMDQREERGKDGVYNRELKLALERIKDKPYAAIFVFHVTIGSCRTRPEPELAAIHRIAIDTDSDADELAQAILQAYKVTIDGQAPGLLSQAR
jgi:hypothetical protein